MFSRRAARKFSSVPSLAMSRAWLEQPLRMSLPSAGSKFMLLAKKAMRTLGSPAGSATAMASPGAAAGAAPACRLVGTRLVLAGSVGPGALGASSSARSGAARTRHSRGGRRRRARMVLGRAATGDVESHNSDVKKTERAGRLLWRSECEDGGV